MSNKNPFGLAWQELGEPLQPRPEPAMWERGIDAAVIILGCFGLLGIYTLAQHLDLQDEMEAQKQVTARYSRLLAACMNGGVLWDKASNTAHFCNKVVSVKNP